MREILFISHRIPFPPDRGDKIRSCAVLKRLAQMAPVHVATFADDTLDMAEEVELAALTRSYRLIRRVKPLFVAGMQAVLAGKPVSLTAFHDPDLATYIDHILATRPISTIYVFSGQMGQYIPDHFAGRVVVDFVDADSAKFEDYARKSRGPMRWIEAREARKLCAEEARLARRADVSLLVSDAEAALFTGRLPAEAQDDARVAVLRNGVDTVSLDPTLVAPEPRMSACEGPRIVFTGQMDYLPNAKAALRVMDRILPLIRETIPTATFHVVGRGPKDELLERHGKDGCYVWGRVKDIRTWLKAADLALIPLDIARGVQNKVLEAMSMQLPVVLSREAATGIDAVEGEHFAVADSDEALAAETVRLLSDRRLANQMGLCARHHLVCTASWQTALASLGHVVGLHTAPLHDAAA